MDDDLVDVDLRGLLDAAPLLLGRHPPVVALRRWLDRMASHGRIKQGVSEAIEATTRADLSGTYYDQVIDAIGLLLSAAQEAGDVRRDLGPEELLLLVGLLWRPGDHDWEARTSHLLELVTDGIQRRS